VDAVFIETHPEPAKAMSDAAVMLPVEQTLGLLGELAAVRGALGG
jgi:2-dehydro-3-deoxyphosphooctonate aldolase (KDO 8-P synthase)